MGFPRGWRRRHFCMSPRQEPRKNSEYPGTVNHQSSCLADKADRHSKVRRLQAKDDICHPTRALSVRRPLEAGVLRAWISAALGLFLHQLGRAQIWPELLRLLRSEFCDQSMCPDHCVLSYQYNPGYPRDSARSETQAR